jgi:hypothetical protein
MSNGEFKARSDRITASARPAPDEESDGYAMDSEPVAPAAKVEDDVPLPAVAETWDTFWPLSRRAKVFGVLMTFNVVLLPLSKFILEDIFTILAAVIANSLAQALVLGTFDRLELKRSLSGKILLIRTWRVAFYPLPAKRIPWREFESVCCRKSHESHYEDWLVVLILFPYGVIPAVLWFWYVMRPERLLVSLCRHHGFPDTVLFRSWDQKEAEDVARSVAEVTCRPWR